MAPANYSGLANLMNLQGVGVNPASQLAYVPSKDLMTRYQTIPNPRTGIPQAVGVTGMAEGGDVSNAAAQVASYGRNGDTTLVHMTPGEVQGLASLDQLTINPDTGLPEAFNMKALLPIIGGIVGSFLLPGAGTALGSGLGAAAVGTGLGTTAGGLLAGQSFGEAALGGVTSGLLSFGIGSILGGATPGLTEGASSAGQVSADIAAGTTGIGGDLAYQAIGVDPSLAVGGINSATGLPTVGSQLAAIQSVPLAPVTAAPDITTDILQSAFPERFIENTVGGGELASAFTKPTLTPEMTASLQSELTKTIPSTQPLAKFAAPKIVPDTPFYSLEKAYEPGTFGKLIGKEAIPAGDITREQFIQLGGTPSDATFKEIALQKAKDPLTYAPLGIAALTGGLDEPYEYEEPPARPAPPTGFGSKTLTGGDVRRPVATEEELRRMALEGGRRNYFTPYRYAAEGGLIGLQQGGMPTPQAPSSMAGMLA